MSGKGDKWRGGWTNKYADSFDRIFNKKGKKKMKHIKHAIKDILDKIKLKYIFDLNGTIDNNNLIFTYLDNQYKYGEWQ